MELVPVETRASYRVQSRKSNRRRSLCYDTGACTVIVRGDRNMGSKFLIEPHEEWIRGNYAFCPKCGGRLGRRAIKASEPDRLVCESCRFVFFLDPKVAVGTIISLDGRCVLLKRGIEPAYGKWVFPGGFVDRGERVEDAAVRETREESHLDVRLTSLLNIYSYADHPVIIIVYTAEVLGGVLAAGDETIDTGLFEPPAIPWTDLAFPSTAQALRDYLARA